MPNTFYKTTFAPLILRLALAAIFLYHGITKVSTPDGSFGASWAAQWWNAPAPLPPEVMKKLDQATELKVRIAYIDTHKTTPEAVGFFGVQLAVAWGELLGGLALALGVFTRLAAAGLIVIQLGAIYTVTFAKGFSVAGGGGYEYNLAILAMCAAVICLGPGPWSVAGLRHRRVPAPATPAPLAAQVP